MDNGTSADEVQGHPTLPTGSVHSFCPPYRAAKSFKTVDAEAFGELDLFDMDIACAQLSVASSAPTQRSINGCVRRGTKRSRCGDASGLLVTRSR